MVTKEGVGVCTADRAGNLGHVHDLIGHYLSSVSTRDSGEVVIA